MKKAKRITFILLALFLTWMLAHITITIIDGVSDENKKADIAVILGTKVNEDGTLSERLQKRLECGLELFRNGRVKKILVSGGLGKEGFYEGDKMKEFLVKNGVADSLIVVDNKGDNTLATVKNTLQLKDSLRFTSLLIVSQYFHITRTKKLFRKNGFENVSGASPRYFEWRDIYSLVREFFAYYSE